MRKIITVFCYCGSAGSGVEEVNAMFDEIQSNTQIKELSLIEFDFSNVRVLSTKFGGRFLERIAMLRKINPNLLIRVENAGKAVEAAFEYQKRLRK